MRERHVLTGRRLTGVDGNMADPDSSSKESDSLQLHFGELTYLFEQPVPRYLTCIICLGLLKEPVATDCCGKMFCESHLSTKKASLRAACPACRMRDYSVSRNKGIDGIVNDMKVHCIHHSLGCEWTGHLCFEPTHRQSDTGCRFEVVSCKTGCGWKAERKDMAAHIADDCPLREFQCEYCSMRGVYKTIVAHWEECPDFPITCPNKCNSSEMKRKQLFLHTPRCPEQVVGCQFKDIGCNVFIKRKDEESHMSSAMADHMMLLLRENRELRKLITTLQDKTASLHIQMNAPKVNKSPKKSVSEELFDKPLGWKQILATATSSNDCALPIVFSIEGCHFEKNSYFVSPTFYTSECGFHLQMTVLPNGHQKAAKRYISLLFHILPGSHDNKVSWPFVGSLKVEVLNHSANSDHFQKVANFKKYPEKYFRRPDSFPKDHKKGGWGILRFMKIDKLVTSTQPRYLIDGKMYIRISLVGEMESRSVSSVFGDSSSDEDW